MSQTLTISAPLAMAAVPTLLAIGGVVVGVALRGYLATGIEVARLNAVNDARTARWLWKRGYRKTPEAGPDLTPKPAVGHVAMYPARPERFERLAIADLPHHDDEDAPTDDTERPYLWVLAIAGLAWGPVAWLAGQFKALAAYLRDRFKSADQLAAEFIADADKEPWHLYDEDELREKGATEQELSMLRRGFVPIFDAEPVNDLFPENLPEPELPPLVLDPDAEAAIDRQRAEWVAANPPTNRGPDGQRHWNNVTAMYEVVKPGRHRSEGYAINVPLQREGGEDL